MTPKRRRARAKRATGREDTQGAAGSWHAGNLSVGEPVFAPVPGDPSEDHGYWTTYAMDRTDGTSVLMPEASRALPYAGRPSDGRPSGVT
ncbi:hypothetical protein ACIOFV_22100 [Streptomyces mirabilis]|uniref:hypothetical protein n=1 Tax=Streptomyces mirabilis TaxID=68239 RepID=UPI00380ADE18